MTLGHFIYSLLLVLLAQVPLVLKLRLDHKERTAPFREQLYRHQLELFPPLYRALTSSFEALHNHLSVAPPGVVIADEHRAFVDDLTKATGPALNEWRDLLGKAELVLPAELVRAAAEYDLAKARVLSILVGHRPAAELDGEWETVNDSYNRVVNLMRLSLGVDTLSEQVHALVVKERQSWVIARRTL